MTSRDRSRRNTPRFRVLGAGRLAELLTERLADDAEDDSGADVWVHLAWEPDAVTGSGSDIERIDQLVADAELAGVGHLVVVSSAMVLGPARPGTSPLPDAAPVAADCGDVDVDRLRAVERHLARIRSASTLRLHVLRPAVVVGPGLDSPFLRHLAAPRLVVARGAGVAWQLCHVDDLARACRVAVAADVEVAAVGAAGSLDALDVTRVTRRKRLELPEAVLLSAAERLQRLGVSPSSSGVTRYLVTPWPVDVARLPEAGWKAEVDNVECLQLLVEQSRDLVGVAGRLVPRREAVGGAAGAAGVTVAAVGAAVLLRRARRRPGSG